MKPFECDRYSGEPPDWPPVYNIKLVVSVEALDEAAALEVVSKMLTGVRSVVNHEIGEITVED